MNRVILLADMNAFFASVHQALDPGLRGKPVVVTGDPAKRHGIVLAASYEAKAYGVKTGMVIREARALCPGAVFIPSQYSIYAHYSSRVLAIMRRFTPLVEPFSIDEAFLDVTGCERLFGSPLEIALKLKHCIRQELNLGCSVGIGPNKLLAKMAAALEKPDGLTVLNREDVPVRLWPLPVRKLFGVGHRYETHLSRLGIHTIGDLANFKVEILKRRFGVVGEILWQCARGIEYSPVDPHSLDREKSMGHQVTLPRDCAGKELEAALLELADQLAARVRAKGYAGRTVMLTLRDPNLMFLSRMKTLPGATDLGVEIFNGAMDLLKKHWSSEWPVRMVGLALGNLTAVTAEQLSFFINREKIRSMEKTCDAIRSRFGNKAIFRAVSMVGGVNHVL